MTGNRTHAADPRVLSISLATRQGRRLAPRRIERRWWPRGCKPKSQGMHTMNKIAVIAKIANYSDIQQARREGSPGSLIRSITVPDASVDDRTLMLSLSSNIIERLGLRCRGERRMYSDARIALARVFDPVQLAIDCRDCIVEVMESIGDCPVLIGRIPLMSMDWHIDSTVGRLVGNPAHGGAWMTDQFTLASGGHPNCGSDELASSPDDPAIPAVADPTPWAVERPSSRRLAQRQ